MSSDYKNEPRIFILGKEIIKPIISEYKPIIEQKGLSITYEDNNIGGDVYCDIEDAKIIAENLIDNACEFTSEGKISIELTQDNDWLYFKISDTGVGIAEEYKSKIYDFFSQEETGYTRKHDGMGLGLPVSKKLCDLNGAEISFWSKKNEGSVFTVKFPRTKTLFLSRRDSKILDELTSS